jgi:hypothetical protein
VSGCAGGLQSVKDDAAAIAADVDNNVNQMEAILAVVRDRVQPFAAMAVGLCDAIPVDPAACKAIDDGANDLMSALDKANEAIALYREARGDLDTASKSVIAAVMKGAQYIKAVTELVSKSSV